MAVRVLICMDLRWVPKSKPDPAAADVHPKVVLQRRRQMEGVQPSS